MADNPQETIRELKDLVVAYAKQETIDPIKGLGRYVGLRARRVPSCSASACFFLAMSGLRALQTETGDAFDDWRSFVPYLIVVVFLAILAAISYFAARRRKNEAESGVTGAKSEA